MRPISHGVVAYFGTYTVNEANRIVTLHIQRSSFPNWEGTDQQRMFEFKGDKLQYGAASTTANPAEAAQLVWKRIHLRARQGMSESNLSRTGKYWFWGIPRKELRFVALEDDSLIADAHGKTTLSGDGGGVG